VLVLQTELGNGKLYEARFIGQQRRRPDVEQADPSYTLAVSQSQSTIKPRWFKSKHNFPPTIRRLLDSPLRPICLGLRPSRRGRFPVTGSHSPNDHPDLDGWGDLALSVSCHDISIFEQSCGTLCTLGQADIPHALGTVGQVGPVGTTRARFDDIPSRAKMRIAGRHSRKRRPSPCNLTLTLPSRPAMAVGTVLGLTTA